MITKDTKESKINTKSKILVLGLILIVLIVLIGLFSPIKKTYAQGLDIICTLPDGTTKITNPAKCLDEEKGTITKQDGTSLYDGTFKGVNTSTDFKCGGVLGINPFSEGCLAELSNSIWVVSSKIARLGGHFLDFFVYYSTNSTSYDNNFINKGWGAIRDVANIFFIITLLYIAIKTVLSLDSHGSKKMIGYVIIIALIINFSLFTTKVVIDSSNILAKIFYNNITSVKPNGDELKPEDGGEKSISLGLISKFNPQEILKPDSPNYDAWTFIFIALFLAGITLYTAYVFFAVAVLFVARVVSLWLAMIFSPLAFISYAVPFDVPFGHKEWWDDLLKNAFLAPIFIFFLYIIVLFTDFLKTLAVYPEGADIFQRLMSIVIPFAILMMLLVKAKGLAVKYSGKIGEAVISGAKMVGGLALGVGAGAAAMGAKTVIGGGGGFVAGQAARGAEKLGLGRTAEKLRDVGTFAQKSSFDVRGVKVAGKSLSSLTGMNVGEAQKGGWTEMKKKQVEKRQKRAEELEKRGTGTEKKAVLDTEIRLKEATLPVKLDLEKANKQIDQARIDLNDAKNGGNLIEINDAKLALDDAKREKSKIRGAKYTDASGTVVPEVAGGLASIETEVHKAKQKLDEKSEEITKEYAMKISGNTSKALNQVFRLGAYSRAGADEAARNIRNGTKFDSGEKPH